MILLLIANGADSANRKAFLSAIRLNEDSEDSLGSERSEDNQGTFKVLLELFTARYPQGKKGFGADLLIAAIKK
jgi:hypothetical protein